MSNSRFFGASAPKRDAARGEAAARFIRIFLWIVTALTALLSLAVLRPPAAAQTAPSKIHGVVTSAGGKGAAGVRVTLILNAPSGQRQVQAVTSAGNGAFEFDDVAPGSYTVKASCSSCNLPPAITFRLEAGQSMQVTLAVQGRSRAGVSSTAPAPSSSARAPGGAPASESLGQTGFDQKPVFKAAPYSNPEAGGGYSDSASAGTERMVREYLAPREIRKPTSTAADGGRSFEMAAKADPTEDHFSRWGNFLLSQHRYFQAAALFDEAVKRYPRSVRLRLGMGIALTSAGKYQAAVRQLIAATDLAPSDPEPYLFLGQATVLERAPDAEATERLKRFAHLDPHNAQALYYYAMSLWAAVPASTDRAHLDPIENFLKTAAALDPEMGQASLELGILYEQEGRDEEALRAYQAAARANPDLAAAHYRLAQAYLRSGDKAAAQKELELYHQAQRKSVTPGHE